MASAGYGPARDEIAIRWLRSTVEIESSWTHESCRIVAATSRVVAVLRRPA